MVGQLCWVSLQLSELTSRLDKLFQAYSKHHVRSSIISWTHDNQGMERGLGTRGFTMSQVELRARVKEQEDFQKTMKLKYRGVPYIKTK